VRSIEIHLADYVPTDLMDFSLFGTSDDRSNPSLGKYYKSSKNLPWGLHIPIVLDHMLEYNDITTGYLHFAEWAQSSGVSYPDWYLNLSGYRDSSKLWPGL
jgi:LruC domain-containing protein